MLSAMCRILFNLKRSLVVLCLLFPLQSLSGAIEKLEVQGLFANKAVLMIDGQMRVLAVGETSPEGVKVVSASSKGAVLEVDGEQKQYTLGNTVSTSFAKRKTSQEKIFINSSGMYLTFGSINGRSVQFLVDTGASAIAMNSEQARQLGIRYDKVGIPANVSTASGFAKGYRVRLKTVRVGKITETNVEAFVIEGNHPGPILLGMTFLGRLSIEHSGNAMTLTQ